MRAPCLPDQELPIDPDDTSGTLGEKLARTGAGVLVDRAYRSRGRSDRGGPSRRFARHLRTEDDDRRCRGSTGRHRLPTSVTSSGHSIPNREHGRPSRARV